MTLSLRHRILLLFLPTLILLIGIGAAGVWMLDNLGRRSEEILRENVVSLRAMFMLHQALTEMERVVLWSTRHDEPVHPDMNRYFGEVATQARNACNLELDNITVPGEREEAEALNRLVKQGIRRGESILAAPPDQRWNLYFDPEEGFLHTVTMAWQRLGRVWDLNEQAVHHADRKARETARQSVITLTLAVGFGCLISLLTGWWLQRTLLGPIRAVTEAATAIGGGKLHLMVPVLTHDEVGQLAEAFNAMTSKLRMYRQSNTERLVRARQTGQATIDSFADPVVVIDTLGRVEVANPSAQRLFGVRPPTDVENPAVWLPPDSLRQPVEEALRQQRVIENLTFDQALTFRLDGDDRVYLPQIRPIRSAEGELLGAAVVLNDVTRFRLLDRLKSDWVATVSHELKTPLTSVRLVVHLLLEEVVGPLEPKQVELLLEARENTERLLKLIEHLLSLARLEDGREQLDLRKMDPGELLRSAVEDASNRAESKRISLVVDAAPDTPAVSVDAVRFGRALGNLLDNAITYTEPGGTVTLSAAASNGSVRLTVNDTGIGIPADSLPHVFDRFFRVPDRDSTPGTGLGLAIVREIVTAHGGEINCTSEVGHGTAFHITLPAAKEAS